MQDEAVHIRVNLRQEGEIIPEGVSYNESIHNNYVRIRHGNCILMLRISKDHPENYEVLEITKEKWDQKLWS